MPDEVVQRLDDAEQEPDDEELDATPWHFKLLLLAFVLYLGFRFVQLLTWAAHHLL